MTYCVIKYELCEECDGKGIAYNPLHGDTWEEWKERGFDGPTPREHICPKCRGAGVWYANVELLTALEDLGLPVSLFKGRENEQED